jgi:hypothetical protein
MKIIKQGRRKVMKYRGGIKILFVAALALIILAGTCAAVSLSNSGGGTWKYQHNINIMENSGTALVDYQILIELKANDFPDEAQSSGADIRFTDASGKELDYWMESWDRTAKSGMVWVKVSSIPADGDARIRMYYGNPAAKSSSKGDETFEFFDDFDGVSLDLKKWKVDIRERYSISDGKLTLEGPVLIGNTNAFMPPRIFEAKLTLPRNEGWPGAWVYFGAKTPTHDVDNAMAIGSQGPTHTVIMNSQDTESDFDIYVDASEQIYTIKWNADEVNFQRSYSTVATFTSSIPTVPLNIHFIKFEDSNRDKLAVDWARVRKYISPEPTVESSLFLRKYAPPYSIKQSESATITIFIKNYLDKDITDITVSDSTHPFIDSLAGDFPNQKKYNILRSGESVEIRYSIRAKKIGDFTLDPVTIFYVDSEGNIQEMKSNPVTIHVLAKTTPGLPPDHKSGNASLIIHGDKTEVAQGEDIMLKISALSLITKSNMHAQVILIPPSGMSVTSSEFSKDVAGQFSSNFELESGAGRDIELSMKSNQIGDFNVKTRIVYYFGDEKDKVEEQILELPIKVRKDENQTMTSADDTNAESKERIPGFEEIMAIEGILFSVILYKRRCRR